MTTLVMLVLGAGIGLGLYLLMHGLRARPVPLTRLVASLGERGTAITELGDDRPDVRTRDHLGRLGVRVIESIGLVDLGQLRQQLRVLDKSIEAHAYEKLLAALAGLLLPTIVFAAAVATGWDVPPVFGLSGSLALGCAGFFYPDLPLGDRVEERRRAFRRALSAYLDLTTILIAGGAHENQAMDAAAEAGDGWAFERLRQTLRSAKVTGREVWQVIDELGVELGVSELRELANSITLAGAEGATIKDTLVTKADAMRVAQAAELEAEAERRTEKMILPVMFMVLGLIFFIGFGAVSAMESGSPARSAPPTTVSR